MTEQEIKKYVDEKILTHIHDGNFAQRVNFDDVFLFTFPMRVTTATIATTGSSSAYFIAPYDMNLSQVYFASENGLATSDTNYVTWTLTNLGPNANGTALSTAMLAATDANTTKTTGGSLIAGETPRQLTVNSDQNNTVVFRGQLLKITATVTNTLANTVTFPNYLFVFK